MKKNVFSVGYGEAKINPPAGIPIAGYYVPRYAKGRISDLKVIALALTQGDETVLLISADLCAIYAPELAKVRAAITAATGIGEERQFITATHTHTGPHTRSHAARADALETEYLEALIVQTASLVASLMAREWLDVDADVSLGTVFAS